MLVMSTECQSVEAHLQEAVEEDQGWSKGSILSDVFRTLLLSALRFWLPERGQINSEYAGGRKPVAGSLR